jgi:serine/threonine protein kinase
LSSFGETQETATIKGTPYFMAPEVLSESKYGRRGDVWAVGCTIIQMLTGDPPWKDRKLQTLIQLHMLLSTWEGIPPIDREIPDDLRDFLHLCFMKDPKQRPMPAELLEHPFLHVTDDEFGDSVGSGATLDIREQLERAVTRASFRPDDTFGDIDRQLAAKGTPADRPPERYRSDR